MLRPGGGAMNFCAQYAHFGIMVNSITTGE